MRRLILPLVVLASSWLSGCAPAEPTRWVEGGAPLTIGRARWERPASATVDLLADGRVLVDGDHLWTIDASGRVFLPNGDPLAVLTEDGTLLGTDDERLGTVGVDSATSPTLPGASLRIAADGTMQHVRDGKAQPEGTWHGCEAPVMRTCVLVTQMLTVQEQRSRPTIGVGVGFGIGFGRR